MTEKQIGQQIRDDGPASHSIKAGTPTMGGTLIFSRFCSRRYDGGYYEYVRSDRRFGTLGTGAVGFADDYLKLTYNNSKGLPARWKLLGQFAVAFIVALALFYHVPRFSTEIGIPFVKTFARISVLCTFPFAMIVIVGSLPTQST